MVDDELIAAMTREVQACQHPIEIVLRPASAFQLVGLLQLALRHPEVDGAVAQTGRVFIEHVRGYFIHQEAAAVVEAIRRGDPVLSGRTGTARPAWMARHVHPEDNRMGYRQVATQLRAEIDTLRGVRDTQKAELDALRQQVESLPDEWDAQAEAWSPLEHPAPTGSPQWHHAELARSYARELRAALSTPSQTETEP